MIGGTGNDTYFVDNAGDVVDETGGDGTDLVQSSVTFSLSDAVHAIGAIENLTLTSSGNINGTGNALANVITGNAGNNILAGLGGADALIGGGGIDTASYAASAAGVDVSLVDRPRPWRRCRRRHPLRHREPDRLGLQRHARGRRRQQRPRRRRRHRHGVLRKARPPA